MYNIKKLLQKTFGIHRWYDRQKEPERFIMFIILTGICVLTFNIFPYLFFLFVLSGLHRWAYITYEDRRKN